MGRVVGVRIVQKFEDSMQHLLDGYAWSPSLALVQDAAINKAMGGGRVARLRFRAIAGRYSMQDAAPKRR